MYSAPNSSKRQARSLLALVLILGASATQADPVVVSAPLLAKTGAESNTELRALVSRVLSEREEWFAVAGPGDIPDISMEIAEESDDAFGHTLWRVVLIPNPAGTMAELSENSRAFSTLASIEPFLRVDLARLYITKNLRDLQAGDVDVDLQLMNAPTGMPTLKGGDTMAFVVQSAKAGYLNVVNVDSQGNMALLFPAQGRSNRINAGEPLRIPEAGNVYRVTQPYGPEYVKAIFTTVPLDLSFLSQHEEIEAGGIDELLARIELTRGGGLEIGTSDLHFLTREN